MHKLTPINHLPNQMFYILRAANERDRWSGQVGFPGGRRQAGETDEETAKREVWEEIGLDVDSHFKYLGRISDRHILQGGKRLMVCCLLFMQTSVAPPLKLEPKEVAACGWVPISHFLKPDCAGAMKVNLQASFIGKKHQRAAQMMSFLGVNNFLFASIPLPIIDMSISGGVNAEMESCKTQALASFHLWGLTLGMTQEALLTMKIRSEPITIHDVFDSQIHNVGVHVVKRAMELVKGRPVMWQEYISAYMMTLAVGLPVTTVLGTALVLKSRL